MRSLNMERISTSGVGALISDGLPFFDAGSKIRQVVSNLQSNVLWRVEG